jgi:hypothetical protein
MHPWWRTFVRPRLEGIRGLAVLTLAAGCALARGAAPDGLMPYTATYAGIWHGMKVAVSTLKLEHTGDTWTYTARSQARGVGRLASGVFPPHQVSVVQVGDQGVLPQSFKSSGGESAKSIDLKYDWQAKKVTGTYEGSAVDLPLTPQVQDDGSVQLALMVAILAGHLPPTVQLIDKNSVREYQFTRDGEETLKTPMGDVRTVVFKSQKQYSPRITRFWCAPDRGYVPMQVEQKKGDDVQWTLRIESLTR